MDLLKSATNLNEQKPYIGFAKLAIGNYEVIQFRLVKNKLYNVNSAKPGLKRSLLVELKDQVLFLPEYFGKLFNDDDAKVAELNKGPKKYLYFGGSRPNK